MRVVMVVGEFPRLSETFLVGKAVALIENGIDLHVVCNRFEKDALSYFPQLRTSPGVLQGIHKCWPREPRILVLFMWPLSFLVSFMHNPAGTIRYFVNGPQRVGLRRLKTFYLDSTILSLQPDIIHFEFGPLGLGRTQLKNASRSRILVSFRGYDINYSGIDRPDYFGEVWSVADAVHFLGRDLKERAAKRGCPLSIPHRIIPPAVVTSDFPPRRGLPRRTAGKPVRIISVGRLEWIKGYEYALHAMDILRRKFVNVSYEIVGDGTQYECLSFGIHQLGLEAHVRLVGPLAPERVRELLYESDIFLHPAVSEGFSNAVLEAQAAGLPVVCSDAGGLKENVLDGHTGFVVPRRRANKLAAQLSRLVIDPALRRRMGLAGRARALAHFGLSSQVREFEEFYRSMALHSSE
jgi:colanic acid/amylovoran biosynthesis glycosyltransferase